MKLTKELILLLKRNLETLGHVSGSSGFTVTVHSEQLCSYSLSQMALFCPHLDLNEEAGTDLSV